MIKVRIEIERMVPDTVRFATEGLARSAVDRCLASNPDRDVRWNATKNGKVLFYGDRKVSVPSTCRNR